MEDIKREVFIRDEEDTRDFGHQLAKQCRPGTVIGLIGDLGTGKTTLTKYIAEGLGIEETITSPTFTIVREYREGRLPLFHFDIYRITNPEDLFEIGADEYFYGSGVCVVEWADQALSALPEDSLLIFMEYAEEEKGRRYRCTF
ncbi:MAG: tRNA (adenosine(37)-N6)-threonylcarbamoyltransferase complex ATPase subunit type 1 TsaE [Firmicutes bacterium]|jgi:tRNA threonylcarbamoyladenosine biosynthesis protein TsaE|nr:tRNA (adenosine(37)-N6)-threonylcarbamoyltransferase complex ATPase subunit type 1 TsaE [Bacillota bacterium]